MPSINRILMAVALIGFASTWGWSQSLQQDSKTGAIRGRVTMNGVPARGITVMAFLHDKGKDERIMFQLIFGGGGDFLLKTATDTNGEFRFSDLKAGEYDLFVSAPAMVGSRALNKPATQTATEETKTISKKEEDEDDEDDDGIIGKSAGGEATDSAKKKITLSEGETVDNIEFSITRGGVITGRVTYADGRPVIGEAVTINKKQSNNDKNEYSLSLEATMVGSRFATDDRGIYRIYGVPDGRYQVSVDFHPDPVMGGQFPGRRQLHKTTFYPGVTDPAAAAEVEVRNSTEVTGIDIKIGAPSKTYVIAGRVIDAETGKPIPGITIHYSPAGGGESGGKSLPSNARGQFKLEGVTSGSYTALANADFQDESDYYGDNTNFEVKDANLNNLDIKMHRGLTISGTVMVEGASSATALTGFAEQVVFGTTWEAGADGKDGAFYSRAIARINADGSFMLKGLKPGNARIGINDNARGKNVFALKRVERGGADISSGFQLRDGEHVNDVHIIVARANCAVIGKVKMQGGSLPKNAQIYAYVRKPGSHDDDSDGFGAGGGGSSMIDKDGNFKIEGLPPGQYEVVVAATLGFNEKDGTPKTREAKQIIHLVEGQELEVELALDLTNLDD